MWDEGYVDEMNLNYKKNYGKYNILINGFNKKQKLEFIVINWN